MSSPLPRLAAAGARYQDPVAAIDWGSADPSLPWLPPDVLSLAALGGRADDAEWRRRFSRVEFARLCAAGLWLEGVFISQLTRRGIDGRNGDAVRVMLQEVREEAGHGLMFLDAIERAGMGGVDLLGPTSLLTWVARRLRPDGAAFWAMTFLGEAVTDALALRALRRGGTICPAARQVLALHHRDEARHIAAARHFIEVRQSAMGPAARLAVPPVVRALLRLFLDATMYPTAASLRALGLPDPEAAARAARACPARRAFVADCVRPALRTLAGLRLIPAHDAA